MTALQGSTLSGVFATALLEDDAFGGGVKSQHLL